MSEITYGRLDEVLRSLGFSSQIVDGKSRLYSDKTTGALIALPVFPEEQYVLPRHLLAVHFILDSYGIANPTDLTRDLSKAS